MANPQWRSSEDQRLARDTIQARIMMWLDGLDRGEIDEVRLLLHPDRVLGVLRNLRVPEERLRMLRRDAEDAHVALGVGDTSKARAAVMRMWTTCSTGGP